MPATSRFSSKQDTLSSSSNLDTPELTPLTPRVVGNASEGRTGNRAYASREGGAASGSLTVRKNAIHDVIQTKFIENSKLYGVGLLLSSVLGFAVMATIVKLVSTDFGAEECFLVRCLFQIL